MQNLLFHIQDLWVFFAILDVPPKELPNPAQNERKNEEIWTGFMNHTDGYIDCVYSRNNDQNLTTKTVKKCCLLLVYQIDEK